MRRDFTSWLLARSRLVCLSPLSTPTSSFIFRFFETFSFLPPLDDDAIAKQVEYIIRNGWTPCLEFAESSDAYVKAVNTNHIRGTNFANYIDNR